MSSNNIDELLLTGTQTNPSTIPDTPEEKNIEAEKDYQESQDSPIEAKEDVIQEAPKSEYTEETANEEAAEEAPEATDDYGTNVKSRLYTEEELNQKIRERVSRFERNSQTQNQSIQDQVKKDFEYNSESSESWMQQLESVIVNTVQKMGQQQQSRAAQEKEQKIQAEFEQRFITEKEKYHDYNEVVAAQPITDAMLLGTRSLKNPAAFLYAAAKRAPKELQRISQISDPYAQIAEIGKLEAKMRQKNTGSKAPRPISRTPEDAPLIKEAPKKREKSIEERMHEEGQKKIAKLNLNRRR